MLEVKILRVDTEDRKIGLSLKRAQWAAEDAATGTPGGGPVKRRGGLAGGGLADLGEQFIKTVRDGEAEETPAEDAPAPVAEEAPVVEETPEAPAPEAPAAAETTEEGKTESE